MTKQETIQKILEAIEIAQNKCIHMPSCKKCDRYNEGDDCSLRWAAETVYEQVIVPIETKYTDTISAVTEKAREHIVKEMNNTLQVECRVKELEDMIDQQQLIQVDKDLIGEQIYMLDIVNGIEHVSTDEYIVIGFVPNCIVVWNVTQCYTDEIENGRWFRTKDEAEQCLALKKGGTK